MWLRIRAFQDELNDAVKVGHKPARGGSRRAPGEWAEPKLVVTVPADDITRWPVRTAEQDEHDRRVALLRFPRVVGFAQDDKSAEDANPPQESAGMFARQRSRTNEG